MRIGTFRQLAGLGIVSSLALAYAACSSSPAMLPSGAHLDAGPTDATIEEDARGGPESDGGENVLDGGSASSTDGGFGKDAGEADAGTSDAARVDAGVVDAGLQDAAEFLDATVADAADGGASTTDAAIYDAAPSANGDDATDASTLSDAGATVVPCTTTFNQTCGSFAASVATTDLHDGGLLVDTCSTASPPAMTGGSIVDGTYALTAVIDYQTVEYRCASSGGASTTWTFRVQGSCFETASTDVHGAHSSGVAELSTSGSTMSLVPTCPGTSQSTTYTASSTTLTFFNPGDPPHIEVLTKVP